MLELTLDNNDEAIRKKVECRLGELEELYGKVPFISKALSERPDIFLPYSYLADAAVQRTKYLDRKSAEIAAVAAGSALASVHCLEVHIDAAYKAGASHDEIMEAIQIGAFMALTKSESVSLRVLDDHKTRHMIKE